MNGSEGSREVSVDADALVNHLSTRQHLTPQRRLEEILAETVDQYGVCPAAVETALEWLRLDGNLAIGRLRRSELIQLARSVHRFWRQAVQAAPRG